MSTGVRATADALAGAMTARDLARLMGHYADDVTFHSPVTPRPFAGRDQVGPILGAVMDGFERWERTWILARRNPKEAGSPARSCARSRPSSLPATTH
jgi:ketosteroid isomerase-like protein